MRILRVAQKLYPEVSGGGPYHVHAMSRDQAAMGHDVTVLTLSDDEMLPRREERDGYTLVRKSPTVELLGNGISLAVANYLRTADDFDVIHAHSHLYFSTNLAALKRRFDNTPLAITNHGLYSQTAPEWIFDLYLRSVGKWTFNSADVLFCYTDEDRERVRDLGVTARIDVVSNGVDTERFTPDGETYDRIDHEGPVILFVGRLVEGKRPQDAIDAISRLPEDLNAKLYIIGDGPMRGELEARADADRVEFIGHVPYDQMPAVYRSGDVSLLPSRAEGLPRTVLEAFASGVPAVTSALHQVTPIVNEAGETVDIGDVEGYRNALERVLQEDGLGRAGRKLVVEEYRWLDTVAETTAALTSIR